MQYPGVFQNNMWAFWTQDVTVKRFPAEEAAGLVRTAPARSTRGFVAKLSKIARGCGRATPGIFAKSIESQNHIGG